MKLVHINISRHIDFDINFCYSLIIENSKEFYRLTNELYQQTNGEEGNFVLSNNDILDISKNCLFIYDYYTNLLSSKKVQNILNNKILQIIQDNDFYKEFSQINKILLDINDKIKETINTNIEYNQEFSNENLLKISNYKITQTNSLIDNIINYIDFYTQNTKINTIIFVGAFTVFEQSTIEMLIKQLKYMQLNVLFIDNYQKYKIDNIETIIIDNDLCVI